MISPVEKCGGSTWNWRGFQSHLLATCTLSVYLSTLAYMELKGLSIPFTCHLYIECVFIDLSIVVSIYLMGFGLGRDPPFTLIIPILLLTLLANLQRNFITADSSTIIISLIPLSLRIVSPWISDVVSSWFLVALPNPQVKLISWFPSRSRTILQHFLPLVLGVVLLDLVTPHFFRFVELSCSSS